MDLVQVGRCGLIRREKKNERCSCSSHREDPPQGLKRTPDFLQRLSRELNRDKPEKHPRNSFSSLLCVSEKGIYLHLHQKTTFLIGPGPDNIHVHHQPALWLPRQNSPSLIQSFCAGCVVAQPLIDGKPGLGWPPPPLLKTSRSTGTWDVPNDISHRLGKKRPPTREGSLQEACTEGEIFSSGRRRTPRQSSRVPSSPVRPSSCWVMNFFFFFFHGPSIINHKSVVIRDDLLSRLHLRFIFNR